MINYEEGDMHSCKSVDQKWDSSQIETISYSCYIRLAKKINPLNY